MVEFSELTTAQKGAVGESIVDKYILEQGFIPYAPIKDAAHPFDRLCATADKSRVFVLDVKSKARRKYYPDTGINVRHWQEYNNLWNKHALDTFLAFVDEQEGRIYGNFLLELNVPRVIKGSYGGLNVGSFQEELHYPKVEGKIVYFPLEAMETLGHLNSADQEMLKGLSTRNPAYD